MSDELLSIHSDIILTFFERIPFPCMKLHHIIFDFFLNIYFLASRLFGVCMYVCMYSYYTYAKRQLYSFFNPVSLSALEKSKIVSDIF